jgi:hypothetical protein
MLTRDNPLDAKREADLNDRSARVPAHDDGRDKPHHAPPPAGIAARH